MNAPHEQPHGHAHAHGHDHGHDHSHDHHPAPARPVGRGVAPGGAQAPAGSLLMSSAAVRLLGAVGLVGLLWVAVAWALAGSP